MVIKLDKYGNDITTYAVCHACGARVPRDELITDTKSTVHYTANLCQMYRQG
jgi:hypothetical protein